MMMMKMMMIPIEDAKEEGEEEWMI